MYSIHLGISMYLKKRKQWYMAGSVERLRKYSIMQSQFLKIIKKTLMIIVISNNTLKLY